MGLVSSSILRQLALPLFEFTLPLGDVTLEELARGIVRDGLEVGGAEVGGVPDSLVLHRRVHPVDEGAITGIRDVVHPAPPAFPAELLLAVDEPRLFHPAQLRVDLRVGRVPHVTHRLQNCFCRSYPERGPTRRIASSA